MTAPFDPKISLKSFLLLEEERQSLRRKATARALRIRARHELADRVLAAQAKVGAAEDEVRRTLPKPLPEDVVKYLNTHPQVMVCRQDLKRLLEEYGPIAIEQAEAIAAEVADSADRQTTVAPSSKPGRKPKVPGAPNDIT